jgi:Uma2 family endonuclease
MNLRVFMPVDKATFYRFIATEPEGRYEYEGGRIVQQMTGGTRRHSQLAGRIFLLLTQQIDATRFEVLPERGIETGTSIRFGDIVVEHVGGPSESRTTKEPLLILEILSPSTLATDLNVKPAEYMSLPSLAAYIVASQTEAACLAWVRGADGAFPAEPAEHAAGSSIAVASLGLALGVDDIYRNIALPPPGTPPYV